MKLALKSYEDIQAAVEHSSSCVQQAPTPPLDNRTSSKSSFDVKAKLREKRHARKIWQLTRYAGVKKRLNKLTHELSVT